MCPNANLTIACSVLGKFVEPHLSKLPDLMGYLNRAIRCSRRVLAWNRPIEERCIGLKRRIGFEVFGSVSRKASQAIRVDFIDGAVEQSVVREASLSRIVEIQHIDISIPSPRIQPRSPRVPLNITRPTLSRRRKQRALTRSTRQVNRQRSLLRAIPRLKVPEERACVVARAQNRGREIEVAAETLDSGCDLADVGLCYEISIGG